MKPSKGELTRPSKQCHARKRSDAAIAPQIHSSDEEYRVGPGHPPKEYQFQPGQSGNPKGAKRKAESPARELRALLQRELNTSVKVQRGEKEKMVTKFAAGIQKLVDQYVEGDHRARRDLFAIAEKVGIDLTASRGESKKDVVYKSYQELSVAFANEGVSLESIEKLKTLDLHAERPEEITDGQDRGAEEIDKG